MSVVPHGWATAPLDMLAEVIRGVTYDKRDASNTPRDGCLPILRATNVGDVLDLNSQMVFVPQRYVRPTQRMRPGDIVVATSSGSVSVVGKSAQLRTPWEGGFGAFCSVIRPTPDMSPQYIAHYIAGPAVRRAWRDLAKGTNINNLKAGDIADTIVPVAPRPEQERIVAAIETQFSRLDAGLAALERVIGPLTNTQAGLLSGLRSSILTAAFSGKLVPQDAADEPASVLLDRIATERAASNGHQPTRPRRPGSARQPVPQ